MTLTACRISRIGHTIVQILIGSLLHVQVSYCKYPGMKVEKCSTLAQVLVYIAARLSTHISWYRIDHSGPSCKVCAMSFPHADGLLLA